MSLNGKLARFEIDSGTHYVILPLNKFEAFGLNLHLEPSNVRFCSYLHDIIETLGTAMITVRYKNHYVIGDLFVAPSAYDLVLGRFWICALHIELKDLDSAKSDERSVDQLHQLVSDSELPF